VALAGGHLGAGSDGTDALAELDAMAPTAVHLQDTGIARGRAWNALVRGEVTAARVLLWDAVAEAEGWGQFASASEALHDLVRMGAGPRAAAHLEELAGRVDGELMPGRLAYARAVDRSDLEAAVEAADRFEAIGANLFAAEAASVESRLAAAAGLRRRAAAAGARATALLARCEGAELPWLDRTGSLENLSRREREVALLAAQDLSSKDIAERLFVSARTVDNHLQRVYTKLGVSGRSQLAERLTASDA
jgi:DNA-binding CsgD family transcriptional regulator